MRRPHINVATVLVDPTVLRDLELDLAGLDLWVWPIATTPNCPDGPRMAFQIRRRMIDAKRDHPDEACGIVAGPEGTDRPERLVEMVNAAGSPTFYEFDSTDLLRLYREMDDRDEVPVVVYHSHTATEAYPSRTDIGLAMEPYAHYVLVSTRDHGNNDGPVEFRSYRIVDGEVTEEEVAVVEQIVPQTEE